jgi:hypothetical protein
VGDLGDIESPRRDVSGNEDRIPSLAKPIERALALILRAIPVNLNDFMSRTVKNLGQAIGTALGASKDKDRSAPLLQLF